MSTTAVAPSIILDVVADNALAARLIHPRAEVIRALRVAIEKGLEIRSCRIRYQEDLDEARLAKLKWTQASIDLLTALFDNTAVADYCNDWVGKIFPEYAEFGNFVEQFYEEMEHRLGKLRTVLHRVEQGAEPSPAPAASATSTSATGTPASSTTATSTLDATLNATIAPNSAGVVTHDAEPIAQVALLGAIPADPAHGAAVMLLKRLNIGARPAAEDPLLIGATDGAVFIVSSQPSDPAAARAALFQIGYAVGRLGVHRVYVLQPAGAPQYPEAGVEHVLIDAAGGWQLQLARHFKQGGIAVDLNKLC
jgi:hypothetical protein